MSFQKDTMKKMPALFAGNIKVQNVFIVLPNLIMVHENRVLHLTASWKSYAT